MSDFKERVIAEKMRVMAEFEAWWDASGWKEIASKLMGLEAWQAALSTRGDAEPVSATIRELVHDAAVTQNRELATELSVYKDAFTRIQDARPQPAPVASVAEGFSYFERFCELLRGLEIPPTAGTMSPDQLFLIGRAIAQKAKSAVPEGYVLVKQDLLDAAKLAVGTPHPHPQYEGHRLILSVHIEALEDALAAQGVKS